MKDVKSVDIVFENCECISIDSKYLYKFSLSGIETSINRVASNRIFKMNTVKHTEIVICKAGNNEYRPFGTGSYNTNIFNRINTDKDIASLYIKYEDDTEECFHPKWTGDSDYVNTSQHSCLTPNENLVLIIDGKYDSVDTYLKEIEVTLNDLDKNIITLS